MVLDEGRPRTPSRRRGLVDLLPPLVQDVVNRL
jgi:hypothetical protein